MPENTKQKKKKVTKAHLRFRRFCAVMILLLIVWWFNNYTLKTVKVTVTSDKVTSPVRIAVISDQHATHLGIGNGRIVRRIKKADPDIVFMLGDMYTSGSSESVMEIPVKLAGRLTDEGYPVYFVSGEHDTDSSYLEALSGAGAEVMNYKELLKTQQLSDEEKTVAILVRNNYHIEDVVREAKKRGIEVEINSGGDLYQLDPSIDLYKLLSAMRNPDSAVHLINFV